MPAYRIDALLPAAGPAVADGEVDQAQRWLYEIDREVEAMGNAVDPPIAAAAKIRHALALGNVQTAAAAVDDLIHRLDAKPIWVPATRALPSAVQALTVASRPDDAAALVARAEQELVGLDAPLAPAALPHAHGFLLAADERWSDAGPQFLTAAERYDRLQAPYEAAQAREQAALALLALDDPRSADELRAAAVTYRALGARWDLDRAASLARRHGVALPARHRGGQRGYGSELSPREHDVARLAAVGLTNKAIADKLFLSPNTVKKHLTAAMRKLDVRTRTALSHRFSNGDPADLTKIGQSGS